MSKNFSPVPTQAPPAWLAEDEEAPDIKRKAEASEASVGSVASNPIGGVELDGNERSKARMVWYGLKVITMCLCVLIFAAAVVRLETIRFTSGGQIFVACYMLFFSALLFVFEAMQTQPIVWLDHMLRRNFGFLYSPMGKAAFIIFIAFLCLGLDGDLSIITGIVVAAFGAGEVALYLKDPKLFEYSPLDSEPAIGTGIA